MPRLRQVPLAEAAPEVAAVYRRFFGERDPVAEPGTATGTPGNWWTTFALVPEVFAHANAAFVIFNSKARALSPLHRELALVRTGFAAGSQFVFSQHTKVARAAGVAEEKLRDVPAWQVSGAYDEAERAVLAYVDAIVLEHGRAQDAVFEALRTHLSDEAIIELSYLVGTYLMHAVLTRALRLEYDDVPERVIEVPVPTKGEG
jgi:alkylhydroperoxidase family enzyme